MNNNTIQNIPQLRFPEFEGEWVETKLGEIGKVSMCKRILKEQTTSNGDIPFYKIGTFGKEADAFIDNSLFEEYKQKYPFPKVGDILISAAGTIGRTVVFDGIPAYFQDSNIVWIANNETIVRNRFLSYCYLNVRWNTENTTIPRLYNDNLRKIKISIPTLPEQTKIATFLTAVDKRINLLQKKKAELEQYKKGVMQKLFSQELRFKQEDGSDFPDWEEKKLGDIAEIKMGQSPDSISYNSIKDGLPLIQGNADIQNRVSKPRQWTNKPTKICDIGDLILTVRAPVGSISKSKHKACIGRGVCSIKNNEFSEQEFIYQLLLWYEPKWIGLEQGSTFTAVGGKDIRSLRFNFPTIPEQQRIANFLSSIDKSIEKVEKQLEASQVWKKGLLQKMFV